MVTAEVSTRVSMHIRLLSSHPLFGSCLAINKLHSSLGSCSARRAYALQKATENTRETRCARFCHFWAADTTLAPASAQKKDYFRIGHNAPMNDDRASTASQRRCVPLSSGVYETGPICVRNPINVESSRQCFLFRLGLRLSNSLRNLSGVSRRNSSDAVN